MNIYPSLGIRALYNAVVYQLLLGFLPALKEGFRGEQHRFAFYPPILAETKYVNVNFQPIRTNVRYDFQIWPEKIRTVHNSLRALGIDLKETNITAILLNGLRAFNCIRYNTPLPLYRADIIHLFEPETVDKVESMIIDGLGSAVRNHKLVCESDNKIIVYRASHDFDFARSVLNALAVTKHFMKIVGGARGQRCEEGVPLELMKNFFVEKIYGKAGLFRLNVDLLQFELDSIKKSSERLATDEKMTLQSLMQAGGSQNFERNFFAHSGFLKDITTLHKDKQGRLFLDYNFRNTSINSSTVQGWLSNA